MLPVSFICNHTQVLSSIQLSTPLCFFSPFPTGFSLNSMSDLKTSETIDSGEGDTLSGIFAVELSHFI